MRHTLRLLSSTSIEMFSQRRWTSPDTFSCCLIIRLIACRNWSTPVCWFHRVSLNNRNRLNAVSVQNMGIASDMVCHLKCINQCCDDAITKHVVAKTSASQQWSCVCKQCDVTIDKRHPGDDVMVIHCLSSAHGYHAPTSAERVLKRLITILFWNSVSHMINIKSPIHLDVLNNTQEIFW